MEKIGYCQNNIVEYFLLREFDYLLFLDDDHSGHTVEMVDALVNANTYFATMKTYVRHFPYPCALMNENKKVNVEAKYYGVELKEGYHQVDLCGFPMSLLRRDLFDKLEKPYFRAVKCPGRDWVTDIEFCERLKTAGIKPIGCFDYCLEHNGITQENVSERRKRDIHNFGDRLAAHFYLKHNKELLNV
jgi:hypothetical protein